MSHGCGAHVVNVRDVGDVGLDVAHEVVVLVQDVD